LEFYCTTYALNSIANTTLGQEIERVRRGWVEGNP
jgi:hypothetical protein